MLCDNIGSLVQHHGFWPKKRWDDGTVCAIESWGLNMARLLRGAPQNMCVCVIHPMGIKQSVHSFSKNQIMSLITLLRFGWMTIYLSQMLVVLLLSYDHFRFGMTELLMFCGGLGDVKVISYGRVLTRMAMDQIFSEYGFHFVAFEFTMYYHVLHSHSLGWKMNEQTSSPVLSHLETRRTYVSHKTKQATNQL